MNDYLSVNKPRIEAAILSAMADERAGVAAASPFGAEAVDVIERFSLGGKMLRGVLVRLGFEASCGPRGIESAPASLADAVDRAGAAMELFQAGLLIHDDIMDRDDVRRGQPTVHARYGALALARGYAEPAHAGEALAICAGDLAFFAGWRVLSTLPVAPALSVAVSALSARELSLVGAAQMEDVANGASPGEPSVDDVLRVYRCKTGRYTFCLPLAVGAALASAPAPVAAALDAAGEAAGILFQLKDDELGLFADAAALGKVAGSDIKENKRTVHRRLLLDRADDTLRQKLDTAFGHRDPSPAQIALVRGAMEELGVRAAVADMMRRYADEASLRVGTLPPSPARQALLDIIGYSLTRKA